MKAAPKIILAIFIAFVSIIIVALVLEIFFRIQNKYAINGIEYDPVKLWHWRANLDSKEWNSDDADVGGFKIFTDRFGYRNTGRSYTKRDNVIRVLVIGDSYTAGLTHPIEKIFTTLLENKLQSSTGKKIEVFNMASPCWSTEQEYLCLLDQGLAIKPDYVLLMVCPNDIREVYCKKYARLENGEVVFGKPPFSLKERIEWKLSNYSYLYQYLQRQVFLTDYGTFAFLMTKMNFSFADQGKRGWDEPLFSKTSFPDLDEAIKLHFKLIGMMNEACKKNNIGFAISSTPFAMEYDSTMIKDTALQSGLAAERLNAFCKQHQIPFIDLNTRFAAYPKPLDLFRPSDAHFSSKGHEIVADELAKYYENGVINPK